MGTKVNYKTGYARCSGCYKPVNLIKIKAKEEEFVIMNGLRYHFCFGRYHRLRYHEH